MTMPDAPEMVLGIDPGQRRVGLALADTLLRVATGFDVIEYTGREKFLQRLKAIVGQEDIRLIVMGLPRNMDGSEGAAAKKSRRLADAIREDLKIEVVLIDERLTTYQAAKQLHEGGGKTGKDKGRVDMLSAALILQSYLDGRYGT